MQQHYKVWVNLCVYTQTKQYTPIMSAIPQKGLLDVALGQSMEVLCRIHGQSQQFTTCTYNTCLYLILGINDASLKQPEKVEGQSE